MRKRFFKEDMLLRPRMQDVAARANVSVTTVSFVLNDRPGSRISAQTRQRVAEAAADLGYVSPGRSRSIASSGPRVGLLGDDLFSVAGQGLASAVVRAAHSHRAVVLLASGEGDQHHQRAAVRALARETSGLLLAYSGRRPAVVPADLPRNTVILNGPQLVDSPGAARSDEPGAVQLAVRTLVGLGHRRIAFVDAEGSAWRQARRRGYADGLAAHGLSLDPDLLVREARDDCSSGPIDRLLTLPAAARPTAVVAATRSLAGRIDRVAQGLSLAAPRDLSVIALDDSDTADATADQDRDAGARGCPPFALLAAPHVEMATWAVSTVLANPGQSPREASPNPPLSFRYRLIYPDSLTSPP